MDSAHGPLAEEFVQLNRALAADGDPVNARDRLIKLACHVIDGCDYAGITAWPDGARPRTLASSDHVTDTVDALQYDTGEGPCLTSADENWTAWSPDLRAEQRWSTFVQRALADSPVRGILALHIAGLPQRHALNLYSVRPGALDQDAVAMGTLFAAHAAVFLAHANAVQRAEGLEVALDTNRQISVAIGMLMATYQLDQDTAFGVLRKTSNDLNRKLRDVAGNVIESGRLPKN